MTRLPCMLRPPLKELYALGRNAKHRMLADDSNKVSSDQGCVAGGSYAEPTGPVAAQQEPISDQEWDVMREAPVRKSCGFTKLAPAGRDAVLRCLEYAKKNAQSSVVCYCIAAVCSCHRSLTGKRRRA